MRRSPPGLPPVPAHADDATWETLRPDWQPLVLPTGTPDLGGHRMPYSYLVRAFVVRGELAEAARLHDAIVTILSDGMVILDFFAVPVVAGMTATATGALDEAEAHLEEALRIATRLDHRPALADARHGYAWMLLRRDGTGDRARANALLEEAIAGYEAMGMVRPLADARALRG
jgi:hypothetical protein